MHLAKQDTGWNMKYSEKASMKEAAGTGGAMSRRSSCVLGGAFLAGLLFAVRIPMEAGTAASSYVVAGKIMTIDFKPWSPGLWPRGGAMLIKRRPVSSEAETPAPPMSGWIPGTSLLLLRPRDYFRFLEAESFLLGKEDDPRTEEPDLGDPART
jgi:hypothetical protein